MAKVLLIDDEKSIRITVAEFLRDAYHYVTTAATAEEAIELVRTEQFDVIITDIILPRINGLELIRQFKTMTPEAEYIVISGEPNVTSVTDALRMGVFDFLPKPVTAHDIVNVVKNAAAIKQLKDTKRRLEEENQRYREHLEKLVAERTAELMQANRALEAEIELRAKTQTELENSRKDLALIINSLPLLIAYFDCDLKALVLNDTFQNLIGPLNGPLMNLSFPDILGEHNWSPIADQVKLVLTGKQVFFTTSFSFKPEQSGFYRVYLIPQKDVADRVKAFIFLAEDITAISTIEHEYFKIQRLESLSTLAEGIANDVNNSLMVIFGNLALLKNRLTEHDQDRTSWQEIERAAEKIKDLTRQLLGYSWKRPITRAVVDLNALAQKTIAIYNREKNTSFRCQNPLGEIKILADEGQISAALYDFIKHLSELAHQPNQLEIKLTRCRLPEDVAANLPPGEYALLELKVGGEIFAPEEIPYIFEPYYRLKRTNIRLDLAAMYTTIHKHEGTIICRVESNTTLFDVLLPIYPEAVTGDKKTARQETLAPHHVLLLDDEEPVMEILSKMLEQLNCHCEMTTDGQSAILLAQQRLQENRPFDLAILDLFIPTGYGAKEVVGTLKTLDPAIKVVVSSGFHLDPILVNHQHYGFDGAVRKPFDIEDLRNILTHIF